MPSKKTRRAQTSLEYLVTYGWALVMIATIIGVLVFATSGSINTNACTTFLSMICKGIGADGDTLILVLQNTTGQKITINPFYDIRFDDKIGYAIITYQGNDYIFDDVTIGAGDQFTISAEGMALATEVSITYTEKATGLTKTVTSSLKTDAPNDVALSNDGTDIGQPAGQVDCMQAGVDDCKYVVEAIGNTATCSGTPETCTITGTETINFGAITGTSGAEPPVPLLVKSAAIGFYVEDIGTGTIASADFVGHVGSTNVKEGWNNINLGDFAFGVAIFAGVDFTLTSTTGSFEINNTDKKPIAQLIVNPI